MVEIYGEERCYRGNMKKSSYGRGENSGIDLGEVEESASSSL